MATPRTTLILGCGYLGRRVGRLLADRGETVFGTARTPARGAELPAWGVRPVVTDVLDPSTLAALPATDRVVYAVGFDRATGVPMRTVYVDGLRYALDALGQRTDKIVYASATSVYGRGDGAWVDEESPAEPTGESGRVCLDAEQTAGRSGLPVVVVRYSGLYGPGRIVRRGALERGEPVAGDPEGWLNLIHIDDAAAAAVAALDGGEPGRVYLASDDRPVRRSEYYGLACRLLNAPEPRFEPPGPGDRRGGADKRVSNARIKAELGLTLRYPHILAGLPAALAAETEADGGRSV